MSILLNYAHLFDEYERNQLSFEILAAIGENQKLKKSLGSLCEHDQ